MSPCVDYGQYATVIANSQEVLALLDKHFNKEDAIRIYACAIIHFVEGFCHMKGMKKIYDQSWLSLRWPFLKMGDRSLSSFYEVLGYRQTGVLCFIKRKSPNYHEEFPSIIIPVSRVGKESHLCSTICLFIGDCLSLQSTLPVSTRCP